MSIISTGERAPNESLDQTTIKNNDIKGITHTLEQILRRTNQRSKLHVGELRGEVCIDGYIKNKSGSIALLEQELQAIEKLGLRLTYLVGSEGYLVLKFRIKEAA